MTYTPLNSGQCDPNKIKQLSFQIVIYKNYNNFQIVIGNSKYMIVLKPEKISGFSGRNLAFPLATENTQRYHGPNFAQLNLGK
jgi:hypothetical protein